MAEFIVAQCVTGLDELIVAIQWGTWHNDDVRCYLKRTFQRYGGYYTMYHGSSTTNGSLLSGTPEHATHLWLLAD